MIGDNSLPILFADPSLIAINKPPGLLSIPDGYNPALPHVASMLKPYFGKIWIVHRLDRDTSGVMLVARTLAAHRALNIQFEQRQVKKIYHALVAGFPDWDQIEVDAPLRINGDRHHRTVLSLSLGKPAKTNFRVVQRLAHGCIIEAQPLTGYTHQIRAHLASTGFPIVGDHLYSRQTTPNDSSAQQFSPVRTCLHAMRISFRNIRNQQPLSFLAPYPNDFLSAIAWFH